MELSHILYKVNDLRGAVSHFREQGFHVEFGSKRRPTNALIYFSEGPYVELLERAPVSALAKLLLRCIGKGAVARRFEAWDNADEGWFEICLENHRDDFAEEVEVMKRHGEPHFITSSARTDPSGRRLTWRLLFPLNNALPFLMTYFNVDPKPVAFVHPNGVVGIDRVQYRAQSGCVSLLKALCEDDVLNVQEGQGGIEVTYRTLPG